jgi:DNA-binding transcriptional LysR family regulator
MNIHHLELFYYVARHGGIAGAVRNMPYGIQQPAVSGQIAQLEEHLGTTLFQRRPFELSPAGERLYQFIEPFFSRVDAVAGEIQGGTIRQIRIGSSDIIFRDHLPELLQAVRRKFPKMKAALREGYQPDLESMLQKQEIDIAITLIETKPPAGIHAEPLLELPLALLVPAGSPYATAEDLWKLDKIEEPLICLPATEAVCRNFQKGLARLRIDWFPGVEVSSLDLIASYVSNGFGIGLTLSIPGTKMSPKVRPLGLPGFAPVTIGALWQGRPTPVVKLLLEELRAGARRLRG